MNSPFLSSDNLQDQDNSPPTPSLKRGWDELEEPSQESWAPLFPSGADESPEYPSKRCCCGFEHDDEEEDEEEDEKINVNLPKCTSCLEDIESATWATMSTCEHTWCSDCISQNIQQAIKSRRSWPPRCCDFFTEGDLEQAKKLIDPELLREWEAKQEELTTRNPTYCPRPECQAFIRNSSLQQPRGVRFVLCWSCQHLVCVECKTSPSEHNKRSSSSSSSSSGGSSGGSNGSILSLFLECPSRIGEENEKLVSEGLMQKCPQCQCLVEKSEGCDHMTCEQCDADFCYRCGDGLVAPLFRCRPECGGGAPALDGDDDDDDTDGNNDGNNNGDDDDINGGFRLEDDDEVRHVFDFLFVTIG